MRERVLLLFLVLQLTASSSSNPLDNTTLPTTQTVNSINAQATSDQLITAEKPRITLITTTVAKTSNNSYNKNGTATASITSIRTTTNNTATLDNNNNDDITIIVDSCSGNCTLVDSVGSVSSISDTTSTTIANSSQSSSSSFAGKPPATSTETARTTVQANVGISQSDGVGISTQSAPSLERTNVSSEAETTRRVVATSLVTQPEDIVSEQLFVVSSPSSATQIYTNLFPLTTTSDELTSSKQTQQQNSLLHNRTATTTTTTTTTTSSATTLANELSTESNEDRKTSVNTNTSSIALTTLEPLTSTLLVANTASNYSTPTIATTSASLLFSIGEASTWLSTHVPVLEAEDVESDLAADPVDYSEEEAADGVAALPHRRCCEEHVIDVNWNLTDAGVLALKPCPSPYTGNVYRACYSSGAWGPPDYTECRLTNSSGNIEQESRSPQANTTISDGYSVEISTAPPSLDVTSVSTYETSSSSPPVTQTHDHNTTIHRVQVHHATNIHHTSHHLHKLLLCASSGIGLTFLASALLCLLVSARKNNGYTNASGRDGSFILINMLLALSAIQIVFLLGGQFHDNSRSLASSFPAVQFDVSQMENAINSNERSAPVFKVNETQVCLGISLFLHFTHLLSAFLMLCHSIFLYQRLWRPITSESHSPHHSSRSAQSFSDGSFLSRSDSSLASSESCWAWATALCCCCYCCRFSQRSVSRTWGLRCFVIFAWTLPLTILVASYLLNPADYETRRYCWMSIKGGMVISFIIPVFVLIMTNTVVMLFVLKRFFAHMPLAHKSEIEKTQPSLRAGVTLLPFFAVNWFLSVLALEDTATPVFQFIFAATNIVQCFLVFLFHVYQRQDLSSVLRKHVLFISKRQRSQKSILRLKSNHQRHQHRHPCRGFRVDLPRHCLGERAPQLEQAAVLGSPNSTTAAQEFECSNGLASDSQPLLMPYSWQCSATAFDPCQSSSSSSQEKTTLQFDSSHACSQHEQLLRAA